MLTFVFIYLFLYFLNYLHPLCFGDDYLYSFIWQGKAMNVPLDENAVRVASWHDIFISQWSHYFTWGGRTVAHVLAQFFLWVGKDIFNYFNAFAGVLLVGEIYWCIHKGVVSLNFDARTVCWIFFVLWAFTPGFSPVFFWLTAACNYLWTNIILIAFILPYIQKYYDLSQKTHRSLIFAVYMFAFGIIAGWTNENSVCWIILALLIFILKYRKEGCIESWMITGLVGLMIGYAFLVFAPGNTARLYAEQNGGSNWLTLQAFKDNFFIFCMIIFFQFFLWYFCLRSFCTLKQMNIQEKQTKTEIKLAQAFCLLSFGMTAIMFFSPGFPPRSGFPGTTLLIIATGIILRLQEDYNLTIIQDKAKKFLFYVATIYFVLTATVTYQYFYSTSLYMNDLLSFVKAAAMKSNAETLIVKPMEKTEQKTEILSGLHIPGFALSENENAWLNVAFARYYGIKGIRMVDEEKKDSAF